MGGGDIGVAGEAPHKKVLMRPMHFRIQARVGWSAHCYLQRLHIVQTLVAAYLAVNWGHDVHSAWLHSKTFRRYHSSQSEKNKA